MRSISFNTSPVLPYLCLSLIVLISDIRIFSFDFQQGWDDQWVAINYYTDQGFTVENIYAIFSEFYHGQFAPVNQLYYTSLKCFFGYSPVAFHSAGVFLHLINTILCYIMVFKILNGGKLLVRKQALIYAFWTSALFAACPVNLEPTAWIAASKILIYALFYFLAIISYTVYLKDRKPVFYYLTILFFFLSFGGKEQAVTLPLCLLLVDLVFKRSLKDSILWLEKAPLFILSLYFGHLTLASQQLPEDYVFEYTYNFIERLLIVPYTVIEYIVKCVFPYKLSYLYPFPFPPSQRPPIWIYAYPLLSIGIIPFFIINIRNRIIFFGCMFFLIHIAIASNIISLSRFAVVADRYAYISSIGVSLLIVHSISAVKFPVLKNNWIHQSLLLGFLAFYVCYTNIHSLSWKNTSTLKKDFKSTIMQRTDYKQLTKRSIENEN